ncbi:hypothetical protein BDN71DRAFT_1450718 [Pleurotus eryngii]|uniref:Formin GTPase-binding domain-containing protein n=1 Tax=Pleurotus eryngii TaxID=5323 RepID=A0A9P5ZT18_PLEER|nr:hypothetical protein BDN71DRAFT_1450718 [Pleurotus eryngii]
MFKNILPSHKRIASTDFTMVTSLGDSSSNGKENKPQTSNTAQTKGRPSNNGAKSLGQPTEKDRRRWLEKKNVVESEQQPAEMEQAFDKLLDDLQIPDTLRPKLNGMDATVKAAMLKSSHILVSKPSQSPPMTPRTASLRRTRSIDSISSPGRSSSALDGEVLQPPRPNFVYGASSGEPGSPRGTHSRGSSFDLTKHFSRSQVNLATSSSLDLSTLVGSKPSKEKVPSKNLSPAKFFNILSGTSSTQMEVETIKKLRLLLRNESASWTQEFLSLGGYNALLTRLNEILEVEWREEQHDDKLLHELLRCLKALTTSSIGCFALRSSCPTPFVQLMSLLFSDKKPGEVATRQLIVDLLLILFELYPQSALPAMSGQPRREAWESTVTVCTSNVIMLPAPHRNIFSLIRALLLTPAPPPSESPATPISPHAFIENLHKPRVYKTYLQELSDVCRDYFWVFCHPNNTIWLLNEVDEGKVEKPRAPGGMTGGVEFEAMGYLTSHLRLINSIAKSTEDLNLPRDHEHSAYRFHTDMFLSGLERIIAISRKASTVYYPNLHLELSRYIAMVGRSGFELPWTITRLIGLPPTGVCRNPIPPANANTSSRSSTPGPRTGRSNSASPGLPPSVALEPIKMGV